MTGGCVRYYKHRAGSSSFVCVAAVVIAVKVNVEDWDCSSSVTRM